VEEGVKRVVALSLLLGCGPEPAESQQPGAVVDTVASRYPDLEALYGGAHGIYRSCAPNEGVCHNNQEYPDLATLGSVVATVGARCNRGRASARELHDLCEETGDILESGKRRARLASISYALEEEAEGGFDDLYAYAEELWLEADRPLPVRVGDVVEVRRVEDGEVRDVQALRVVAPRGPRPQRPNVVPVQVAERDDVAVPYGFGRPLREGDPNQNGVLGARLSGGLVVPGVPERSYLMRRLVDPSAGPLMPRANCCTWTKASLRAMWCWIAGLEPDGSNALDPIDYERCPDGPEEAVAYPKPGPSCATSGRCPVKARVELDGGATWEAVYGLLASRCGDRDCHGPGTSNGLTLAGDTQARQSVAALVVPGEPARSELYRRIVPDLAEASAVELMPLHGEKLTLRERELVRAFIGGMQP
jgi:hypothetical protein